MIEHKYGRVIFTSSTAGLVAEYAGSAYNSSKHALLGLMRSIAQDAGAYGITSNAVARRGEITDFTGVSAPYEPPEHPELHLASGARSIAECAAAVHDLLATLGLLAPPPTA
jgi:NAD(P)-dependent dehydrogenase (short-subunit alcohol dehydrogenase family)